MRPHLVAWLEEVLPSSAAATLAELGYTVETFCYQDSPRRAHSIAAQGGINAAKNYQNDGDSIYRLYYDTIKGWVRALSERSYALARSGAVPIFMGGDHSLSMGSVNGVARYWREQGRPLFVLWVDAHADYNTPQTTETGNMHGMSAAFLCGEGGLDNLLGGAPRASIGPGQLDLLGIRSIDPLE